MSRSKEKIDFCDDANHPDAGTEIIGVVDFDSPPGAMPLWYEQVKRLPENKRRELAERVLERIRLTKPDAYASIKKMKMPRIGFVPEITYTLISGDDQERQADWIHAFGSQTLLFWCKQGGFGIFINENLDYDDTILNRTRGNPKQTLRGFTG